MHKDVIMTLEKYFTHAEEQLEILGMLNDWLYHDVSNHKSPFAKICDPVYHPENNSRIIRNKKNLSLF